MDTINKEDFKRYMEEFKNEQNKKDKIERKFYCNKGYMGMIESFTNDITSKEEGWTVKHDIMFDFLNNVGFNVLEVYPEGQEQDIVVKYKDKYIEMSINYEEDYVYGEKVVRLISPVAHYVRFEDIVKYQEDNIRPDKTKALEAVHTSFNVLDTLMSTMDKNDKILSGEEMDIFTTTEVALECLREVYGELKRYESDINLKEMKKYIKRNLG